MSKLKIVRIAQATVDGIQETIQESKLASKALKDINTRIDALEEKVKANTPGDTKKANVKLIKELRSLSKRIQKDPYDSLDLIDSTIASLQQQKDALSQNNSLSDSKLEIQVMYKSYESAINACLSAKKIIEDEKLAEEKELKEAKLKKIIIQPKNTDIKLLIPEGYEKAKYKNPAKGLKNAIANDEIAISKVTDRSVNIVIINKIDNDKAIPFDGKDLLIDGIHKSLNDNQGLIEVESGKTKRGYDYIYSIIKELNEESLGVTYLFRMHIGNKNDTVEIMASFREQGMTGERDSFGAALAQNAGIVSFGEEGLIGWSEDPYDPQFSAGIPMNLSERPALDALFPDHPLSQARELVVAIVEDKHILCKKQHNNNSEDDINEISNEYKNDQDKFYHDLFAKESVLKRPTVDIELQ